MKTTIQETPDHRLDVSLERVAPYGTWLKLITFAPMSRHPREHVDFQALLSDTELKKFQKVFTEAVAAAKI